MKRKLLFAAALLVGALGFNANAQEDVTDKYLVNPSFELANADTPLSSVIANAKTDGIYGWKHDFITSDYVNYQVMDQEGNGIASVWGTNVIPSEGNYYLFYRQAWDQAKATFTTSAKEQVEVGKYTLAVQYKGGCSYNGDDKGQSDITLNVKSDDGTVLQTKKSAGFTRRSSNAEATAGWTDFNGASWGTVYINFEVEEAALLDFVIILNPNTGRRTDMCIDNIRLFKQTDASWTAGDYYIYNNDAAKYMCAGNSWGTQASLTSEGGLDFYIEQDGGAGTTVKTNIFNKYLGINGFCDSDIIPWMINKVADGEYTIQSVAGKYLAYEGTVVTSVDNVTDAAKWNVVSSEDRIAALSSATKAEPTDATFFITNPNFGREQSMSAWNVTPGNSQYAGVNGDNENFNWQQWNAKFDINQQIAGLPGGKYKLLAQGFYRPGANDTQSTNQNAVLYAGDLTSPIVLVSSPNIVAQDNGKGFTTKNTNEGTEYYVPNTQGDASKAFSAGYYENEIEDILVTDGTLTVGAKCETTLANEWTVIDNFRLFYYGPAICNQATELPVSGMTANEWYYFDILVDGDYGLKLTTLNDVVYTTDGTVLVEDGNTITDKFSSESNVRLTAGRYYVKSSSDQAFAITYAVTIGESLYTSYVTKFDTDFSKTENLTAYAITGANAESVELEPITAAPAGEAVVLKGTAATVYVLEPATNTVELEVENIYKPGDGEVKGDGSVYALGNINGNVGFYLVAEGTLVPEDKGYLVIKGADVKNFIPFGDGDATGIESVEAQNGVETGVIYNLAGQRVVNPTNGIYIVNGKKVLINK